MTSVEGPQSLARIQWHNHRGQLEIRRSKLVGVSAGRSRIFVTSEDFTLRAFYLQSGALQKEISIARAMPEDAVLSGDEGWAIVGNRSGRLHVVDLEREQVTSVTEGHNDLVASLVIADTGLVVSGARDGTIRLWQLDEGRLQLLFGLEAWSTPVKKLAISRDGAVLAVLLTAEAGVRLVKLDELRREFAVRGLGW